MEVAHETEQAAEPALAGEFDPKLFWRLKALRLDIAQAEGVPPHVVFHKFSLQDMAVNQPRTLDALAECYGVDAEKLERYGERFLAVLNTEKSGPATSEDMHGPESQDLISDSDLSDKLDPELFDKLKALRLEIAQAEDMSPLAVFPNRTLMEMTVLLPHTPDALAECHGVGPRKLERYGARFLDGIRAATSA